MSISRRESLLGLGAAALMQAQKKTHTVCIIGNSARGAFGHNWDLAWNRVPGAQVLAVSDPDEAGRTKAQKRSAAGIFRLSGYAPARTPEYRHHKFALGR